MRDMSQKPVEADVNRKFDIGDGFFLQANLSGGCTLKLLT